MKSLKKEISFDGSKFWLKDEVIGEVDDDMKFRQGYDKDYMDEQKEICLGKITKGDVA